MSAPDVFADIENVQMCGDCGAALNVEPHAADCATQDGSVQVWITDVDQETGAETARGVAYLTDCFPDCETDQVDEYADASRDLQLFGRHWVGGGAAALVRLALVTP